MLLRYEGPSGVVYERLVAELDKDDQPVRYAPYTFEADDESNVVELAVNPDPEVFTEVDSARVIKRADNDPAPAEPETPDLPTKKPDLIALAKERGLDTSGTVKQLKERLIAAALEPDETDKPEPVDPTGPPQAAVEQAQTPPLPVVIIDPDALAASTSQE